MASLAEVQRRRARERRQQAAAIAPQFPDIQEVAKLVPEGRELIPGLTALAGDIEVSGLERQRAIAEAAQPGVGRQFGVAGGQIEQMLAGQVPQDVIDRLQSNVAARALTGGVPGSGFAGSQFARTLGLTSLDLVGRGISGLLGLTPVAQETFGVEPVDIGAQIPGTTDIFNQMLGQELARSQTELALLGLSTARAGTSAGAGGTVGGPGFMPTFAGLGAPVPTNPAAGIPPNFAPATPTFGTRTGALVGVGGTQLPAPGVAATTPTFSPGAVPGQDFPLPFGQTFPQPTGTGGTGQIVTSTGEVINLGF